MPGQLFTARPTRDPKSPEDQGWFSAPRDAAPGMSDSTEQAIYDLFQEIARKQPDSVALVHSSERLTYAELRTRAARLARRIQRQVHPGKGVAILLPETSASIVAVLACLAAARISVVLIAYHPAQRNAEILRDA